MSVRVRFTAIRANAAIIPGPKVYAALHEYTRDYCAELITEVSQYPPEPVNVLTGRVEYKRTFRLLANWRLQDVSSGVGIQYQISNSVQDRRGRYYSGYVHGMPGWGQTGFHAEHGWKNMLEHIDRESFREGAQVVMVGAAR